MKKINVFGLTFCYVPTKEKKEMRINGYNYTKKEVLEALQNRGYEIVKWEYTWIDETFPNGPTVETEIVDCAIKPLELPYDENIWYKVAKQEFETKIKPKLV